MANFEPHFRAANMSFTLVSFIDVWLQNLAVVQPDPLHLKTTVFFCEGLFKKKTKKNPNMDKQ